MKHVFSYSSILTISLIALLPCSAATYAVGIQVDEMNVTAYVSRISTFSVTIGSFSGSGGTTSGAGGADRSAAIKKFHCTKNAINAQTLRNAPDKGNYLCSDCVLANFGVEEMLFIKSAVNQNVDMWRPNDTVTVTNGSTYSTFFYNANGNFSPKAIGNGVGPGKAVNHDGKGNAC